MNAPECTSLVAFLGSGGSYVLYVTAPGIKSIPRYLKKLLFIACRVQVVVGSSK